MSLMPQLRLLVPQYPLAKLFQYAGGTVAVKQNTYTAKTLAVANDNPMQADANGLFTAIYLDPALSYKFVLAPSTDTDPPTNAIFSQDQANDSASGLLTVLSKTSNYAIVSTDGDDLIIAADATAGSFTLTLYTALGNSGRKIRVVKIDASTNIVTIDPTGTETVNGQLTTALTAQYEAINITSDASNWIAFADRGRAGAVTSKTANYTAVPSDSVIRVSSPATTTTGVQVLPQAVINVTDTSAFPTSGSVVIATTLGLTVVAYTGKSGTTLTGCTGGTGSTSNGGTVTLIVTITLYPAANHAGRRLYIKNEGTGFVTVAPNAAETIDTVTKLYLSRKGQAAEIVCDGANWQQAPRTLVGQIPCNLRLTLTAGTPVTTADVTAATSVIAALYGGDRVGLYDGAFWNDRQAVETPISLVGLTASKPYDIFCYDSAGIPTYETLVWTNATTRATAITTQNGVPVKSGDATRLLIGCVYVNSTGGQTDDTLAKRYVWNQYNRVDRALRRIETTATWTYNSGTIRQANGSAANQVEVMIGQAEDAVQLGLHVWASGTSGDFPQTSIGLDSTTVFAVATVAPGVRLGSANGIAGIASYNGYPGVGLHALTWLEARSGAATLTFSGSNGANDVNGLFGIWRA